MIKATYAITEGVIFGPSTQFHCCPLVLLLSEDSGLERFTLQSEPDGLSEHSPLGEEWPSETKHTVSGNMQVRTVYVRS